MGCCLSTTEENQDNCNPNDYKEFQEQCSNQNLNEDVTELGADDNDSGKYSFTHHLVNNSTNNLRKKVFL